MKKIIILLTTIFILTSCYSNPEDTKKIAELKNEISKIKTNFQGKYSFGIDIEKGRVGTLLVHKSDDGKYYYDLYSNKGAPSYNMGNIQGKLFLNGNEGTNNINGCNIIFDFYDDVVIIKSLTSSDCGFGGGVTIDGNYKKEDKSNQIEFYNMLGEKESFKNIY